MTGELDARPRRTANHAAEVQAMVSLAERLSAPRSELLTALVEHAATLCQAHSAGLALLDREDGRAVFRWEAIVGPLTVARGGRLFLEASGGTALVEHDAPQLLRDPKSRFVSLLDPDGTSPPIVEALTAAMRADDRTIGVLWVVTHSDCAAFDGDDARVLADLARFAAGAIAGLEIERQRVDVVLQESEAHQHFLSELAEATRPLTSPDAVMALTARMLADHVGADRCAYADVEDESVFVITGDFTRAVPSIVGRWSVASFGRACEQAMLDDRPYVVEDVDTDPRIGPDELPAYRATTICAVICVPLHKEGRFSAAMAVHCTVPRRWTSGEVRLLREVVARCWEAIERAHAARALLERDERLGYAVRLSGVGFWYCDLPFDELQWDTNVKRHFWLPHDARVTMETFYDRIHPDDRERTRVAIESSINDRIPYDIDYRTVDPATGAVKWVRALGGTAYAEDGTPRRFDGVIVDVTLLKLEEQRLARALERERADTRLLQKIADASLSIHAAASVDGVLQNLTEQARRILGASTADASIDGHVESRHDARRDALAVPFTTRSGESRGFIRVADKLDGELTETDETVLVQLAHIASVAIESARLNDELREQDRRKDEFLATLAHELRNPLAPIRMGIEVLKLGALRDDRALVVMERQVGHMVRLVDDLLDLSRINRATVDLKLEYVDLRDVVESALETSRPLITAANHELEVRLPAEPLVLSADSTRMSQVLANLFNNATKYTPRGGRILCAAHRAGDSVVVEVSDNGVGIPRAQLSRVFDMFVQVGSSVDRVQGGLGIGLTLARRLVELHGGTIEARSEGEGRGSTFTLRLPLAEGTTSVVSQDVHARVPVADQGIRVLIVDDNVDAAEFLQILLERAGHTTRLAHTGTEALATALALRPDLVVLDIGLPGMNGYEVCRAMRETPELAESMIVALTGWGTQEDQRRAREAGFDRHWTKPVSAAVVHAAIADLARRV